MLKIRIVTAFALLVGLSIILKWAGPGAWAATVLVVMVLGVWEWTGLSGISVLRQRLIITIAASLTAVLVIAWLRNPIATVLLWSGSAVFWVFVVPFALRYGPAPRSSSPWVSQVLGVLLLCAAGLGLLIARDHGNLLLLSLLGVAWAADIAAYFTGKGFGKHKLAPAISPGKTWEGAAGGLVGVSLYGWAWIWIAPYLPAQTANWPAEIHRQSGALWFSVQLLLLAVLGIVGDLYESLLKRRVGVKDSGNLLPGHGGVLDRIDAQLAVVPVGMLLLLVGSWFRS
ncbi:MAG: phosphatidate cytidylyltransferase [Burkholderiaceae bacterium]